MPIASDVCFEFCRNISSAQFFGNGASSEHRIEKQVVDLSVWQVAKELTQKFSPTSSVNENNEDRTD